MIMDDNLRGEEKLQKLGHLILNFLFLTKSAGVRFDRLYAMVRAVNVPQVVIEMPRVEGDGYRMACLDGAVCREKTAEVTADLAYASSSLIQSGASKRHCVRGG